MFTLERATFNHLEACNAPVGVIEKSSPAAIVKKLSHGGSFGKNCQWFKNFMLFQ
jgi:hypothetical protein